MEIYTIVCPPKTWQVVEREWWSILVFFYSFFSNKPSEKLVQSVQLEWYIPHKGPGTHPSAEIFKPPDFFDFFPGSIQPFFVETTLPKININPAIYWLEDYFSFSCLFSGSNCLFGAGQWFLKVENTYGPMGPPLMFVALGPPTSSWNIPIETPNRPRLGVVYGMYGWLNKPIVSLL